MGAILASALIDKAAIALTDVSNTRWTRAELLKSLNQGQRQIVQIEPAANNTVTPHLLLAGTRQPMPADSWLLLDITRNMGAGGTTAGRSISVMSRELLSNFNPDWHTATATTIVQGYIYSPQDPDAFYVFPPSLGTWYVELNYSAIPADIAEGTAITISDVYEGALLDYMLYRAASKDAEYAQGLQAAQMYLQGFTSALGAGDGATGRTNPNNDLTGTTPTPRGNS